MVEPARQLVEHLHARADVLGREAAELLDIASRDLGPDRGRGQYNDAQKRLFAAEELRAAADVAPEV
jgi:hypothetical protein